MGEHGQGDVAVPGVVAADLVVVEPDLGLRGLEALLDRPPGAGDPDQVIVGGTGGPALLEVALDGALGADVGAVGVLTGVTAGPALAQQVPALVELDLDIAEAFLLVLVEAFAGGLALEGVLLLDQGADAVEDLPVVHRGSLYCICWCPGRAG